MRRQTVDCKTQWDTQVHQPAHARGGMIQFMETQIETTDKKDHGNRQTDNRLQAFPEFPGRVE